MHCKDCNKKVPPEIAEASLNRFGVLLCERHARLVESIIEENNTPIEAIQLFYALKEAGANPMLEWWDGNKSIDIAISRVKLNIEIETDYHLITHEQANRTNNQIRYAILSYIDDLEEEEVQL